MVESYRDEAGRVKKRTVATLGRLDQLTGELDSVIDGLLKVAKVAGRDPVVVQSAALPVGATAGVSFESVRAAGNVWTLTELWNELGFSTCAVSFGTPANPLSGSADRGVSSSSVSKSYHYEDARHPALLTGISIQGQGSDAQLLNQRLVTWGYDAKGRANLSVKGQPARLELDQQGKPALPKRLAAGTGIEQVTLEFKEKRLDGSGITILTNSLGQTTRYDYAQINGTPQILEVRGAGCASCGPANVRNIYDSRGRQTQRIELDASGQALRGLATEYDGAGSRRAFSELPVRQ